MPQDSSKPQAQLDQEARDLKLTVEVGDSGLKRQGGLVYEEFLRELSGTKAVKVYKEMSSNDYTVGAILFAINMLIRGAKWRVELGGDQPVDQEAADFLESCMGDMDFTWDQTIDEALSMLTYGWALHEQVYKRRLGRGPTELGLGTTSKYSDGRIGWKRLPIRSQDTLYQWDFVPNGDVKAMIQQSPVDYTIKTIPMDKALLFRTTTHKNNPEGRSILRNAYRPWYFKKNIENIEGIGIERDLAGLPVAWVPAQIMEPNAAPEDKAVLENFKKIIRNIRRDEQEGLVMPLVYDENGNKLYDFGLIGTGSRRNFDTNQIISRYDRGIAISVLADFIFLGHEKVGSFALASSKTNLFATAIGAYLDIITEVFNSKAIPDLFSVNTFPISEPPKLAHGDIETVDLAEFGGFISALASSGMPLFPDDDLEKFIRQRAGLPQKKEPTAV